MNFELDGVSLNSSGCGSGDLINLIFLITDDNDSSISVRFASTQLTFLIKVDTAPTSSPTEVKQTTLFKFFFTIYRRIVELVGGLIVLFFKNIKTLI